MNNDCGSSDCFIDIDSIGMKKHIAYYDVHDDEPSHKKIMHKQ